MTGNQPRGAALTDEGKNEEQQEDSEAAAEGPGNVSVDEPTDTSLSEHNDESFRDGVPEPGEGEKKDS
ncbi:MAG TPA: hypothetical protein VJ927_11860 [Actinomycetota bacterium]|nr:hypothetical protein [Actinomycetota bacterium]